MPLTKTGSEVMSAMKKQYGNRAKNVFYASINKGVAGSSKWHLKKEHISKAAKKLRG